MPRLEPIDDEVSISIRASSGETYQAVSLVATITSRYGSDGPRGIHPETRATHIRCRSRHGQATSEQLDALWPCCKQPGL